MASMIYVVHDDELCETTVVKCFATNPEDLEKKIDAVESWVNNGHDYEDGSHTEFLDKLVEVYGKDKIQELTFTAFSFDRYDRR